MDVMEIFHGQRVLVWDHLLWRDNTLTPNCYRPATVVACYGEKVIDKSETWIDDYWDEQGETIVRVYGDLVDVKFDHSEHIFCGHFTSSIRVIDWQQL